MLKALTYDEEFEDLFVCNLPMIDRIVRSACRPYGMSAADVEDFASHTRVRLIECDYAILRKFQHRCSLGGYLSVVIQRLLGEYRNHALGKWRASAEAKRLGTVAMRIEKLLVRDRLPRDEVFRMIETSDAPLSRAEFDSLIDRLPVRQSRPRFVAIDTVAEEPAMAPDPIENDATAMERATTCNAVAAAVTAGLAELTDHERVILRLHFVAGLSVAEIARSLQVDQKPLYRRLDRICKRLRCRLADCGIDRTRACEIVGQADVMLNFGPALDGYQ